MQGFRCRGVGVDRQREVDRKIGDHQAVQHYLLLGFGKLRNYFMMMGIVIIVVVSGMVLVFCGGIMCAGMMR